MKDLEAMSNLELLQTHGAVIAELHNRKVVRTKNNPIGDYTEWLVCGRLGLRIQGNSQAGFDAVDPQDKSRYQIKGRQSSDARVQFGTIRNLESHGFDFVVAVVFHEDYSIRLAVKIPYKILRTAAGPHVVVHYQEHVKGHNLTLTERAAELDGVEDITHLFD